MVHASAHFSAITHVAPSVFVSVSSIPKQTFSYRGETIRTRFVRAPPIFKSSSVGYSAADDTRCLGETGSDTDTGTRDTSPGSNHNITVDFHGFKRLSANRIRSCAKIYGMFAELRMDRHRTAFDNAPSIRRLRLAGGSSRPIQWYHGHGTVR